MLFQTMSPLHLCYYMIYNSPKQPNLLKAKGRISRCNHHPTEKYPLRSQTDFFCKKGDFEQKLKLPPLDFPLGPLSSRLKRTFDFLFLLSPISQQWRLSSPHQLSEGAQRRCQDACVTVLPLRAEGWKSISPHVTDGLKSLYNGISAVSLQ